jgi:hypothetical protein
MKLSQAWAKRATGGIGWPSKMPGGAIGLPAADCRTGQALAAGGVDGPCADCYATKANYQYPSVQVSQARRLALLDHPDWKRAMVWQIERLAEPYFRWHDSGDIQSERHLDNILDVCEATPAVRHWLPTQEWSLVRKVRRRRKFPRNLVVRFSARKYGDRPRMLVWRLWSSVERIPRAGRGRNVCPAPLQGNACGACRKCWDPKVKWVIYTKH